MLFKEYPSKAETKKLNKVNRPERNRKEKEAQVREELSQVDILDLMGVNERGHRKRRGAWRQV